MQLKRYAAGTDMGLQRSNNEDSYCCDDGLSLWVVADGMGGHAAGEVASEITSTTIKKEFSKGANLTDAIQNAHHAVLTAAANGIGGQGMGSTVVAMCCNAGDFQIAWVGDSRAYLWSPFGEKQFQQLTRDHSYVQMLFDSGAIAEEELQTHPEKNIITQCLGSIDLDYVQVDVVEGVWRSKDAILLCSDGLSDFVSQAEMQAILQAANTLDLAVRALIQKALEHGGRDNITVILIAAPTRWSILKQKFFKLLAKIRR